ncbi:MULTISPECIES: hypothetical protein [unclassified Nocardioides]|uniref:hypothetical protein n=1 Tax=unclassified Nocardioides TaxID=2615069 RepID=UPI0000571E06|nr:MULTISPECIES: hypothetical protein [unclassified Nocardioides]ABL80093.1 hypothetical protein Noca_0551 [Nocardioides sp. JS614]
MAVTEDMTRVRQIFDEAMAETFDALFKAPDAVAVVAAVAQGDLAIVITGSTLHVVSVTPLSPAPAAAADDDYRPGMYL